ncbi:baculoviral IAP repeat-containing protein 7-like [Mya arenaria]|uniref:baculoviral IAP repeat-containing protein 7-like n=1 Tax=Mya arenaria TaxID=6604 RepID=UPI0022E93D70|nr:baculoviral IAP repeat-containing protein 7-like [Mya arenaria]
MKPKYPQYALPSKRQESFTEASIPWPQDAPVGVEKLVEAGLVYTGVGDNVRCYHCGGGLRSWKDGDDPMEEHAKWYPTCQHVLIVKGKTYIRKVEAGKKPKADSVDERMASKESVVTTKQKQDVQKPTPMGLGISTMKPKYPQYALPSKRQESFTEASIPWPQDAPVGVEKLVEAGLMYTGEGDSVRCYHCGGGLRNWEEGDDPMEEHAKLYPTCQHVLITKSKRYIRKVEAGGVVERKKLEIKKEDPLTVVFQTLAEFEYSVGDARIALNIFKNRYGQNASLKAVDLVKILDNIEGDPNIMNGYNDTTESMGQSATQNAGIGKAEENKKLKRTMMCHLCKNKMANNVFLPCGHLLVCEGCVPLRVKICFMCKTPLEGMTHALRS